MERWSFGALLAGDEGQSFVVWVSLARFSPVVGGSAVWHTLGWALTTQQSHARVVESWMDAEAVAAIRKATAADTVMDRRVRTALLEALADGIPVAPDRLLPGPVRMSAERSDMDFGGVASLREAGNGAYRLALSGHQGARAELQFLADKRALPYDEAGQPRGYALPRCVVTGTVLLAGDEAALSVSGSGWHEQYTGPVPALGTGSGRLMITLDNGWDIVARHTGGAAHAIASPPDGAALMTSEAVLTASDSWTSFSTLNTYPSRWELRLPAADTLLTAVTEPAGQEVATMTSGSHGHLWATAQVHGTMAGKQVSGDAWVEVVPERRLGNLEEHIGQLREVTRREVVRLYPDRPSASTTASLMGGCGASLDGVPDDVIHDTMIRPIRHLTDADGRGWRTYVCCAALELLGVDSTPYTSMLAAVEVIHSANLAIDDVQDGSAYRRGVPAVHTVFDAATTINAGTAAYFVLDRLVDEILPDDDAVRLRFYRIYVGMLRAAHGGQAIDLHGHTEAMDEAVATADACRLLARIRAAHRFKTGLPARAFGEVGALIAGADDQQITAIGHYFEAVGTAYQYTDDLLDLLGATAPTSTTRKHSGEDLRAGKVTMPLAHAVPLMPPDQLASLWKSVRDGDTPQDVVREAAHQLIECGAVKACYAEAEALVEGAWRRLDPLIPTSITKVFVRALGTYAALREPEFSGEALPWT